MKKIVELKSTDFLSWKTMEIEISLIDVKSVKGLLCSICWNYVSIFVILFAC